MKDARCWTPLAEDYKPLRRSKRGPGIALTLEEERRLFEAAQRKSGWEIAYFAALLAANTTLRGGEVKGLRLGNIDLFNRSITVQRDATKTDAGRRSIPLNETALWATAQLLERAGLLGATDAEHYLLPAFLYRRTKQAAPAGGTGHDPTHPMKTWRTAWRSLRKAAGLPTLRFHDLRHTCITKLAEAGVPDHVLMSISGHISPEMIQHYAHIRSQAKEAAIAAMRSYSPPEASANEKTPAKPVA